MIKTEEIMATKSTEITKRIKQKKTKGKKLLSGEWSVVRKYVSRKGAKAPRNLETDLH